MNHASTEPSAKVSAGADAEAGAEPGAKADAEASAQVRTRPGGGADDLLREGGGKGWGKD